MIKAYIKTPYNRNRNFQRFWKKNFFLCEKKKKPNLSYPGLRYAHKKLIFACKNFFSKNVCLRTKFDLRLKKKNKITWKNFCVAIKKCQSYNFHIWKLYGKHYFQRNILNQFFLSPVCSTVLKKPQKWFNFFSIVFRKCMKIVWQAFSPYTWCMDLYDNDFCCMELYDKHFRCMEVNPGVSFP